MSEARYPYVHVRCDSEEQAEQLGAELWMLGASGIEERDASTMSAADGTLLVASFDTEDAANAASAAMGERAHVEFVVGDEWRDAWREYFHPTRIGERLLLKPSWREAEAPEGVRTIIIDPGAAFGSGIHETTRLCLKEVDALIEGGEDVLDIGMGSGILSIAALLLGAKSATGNDIDELAVTTAIENAERNGVSEAATFSLDPLDQIGGEYPVVFANIQAVVLIPLADEIIAKTKAGGTLVLSGVLAQDEDRVIAHYLARGVELVRVGTENAWRSIVLRKLEA